jgi:hypothetical protein
VAVVVLVAGGAMAAVTVTVVPARTGPAGWTAMTLPGRWLPSGCSVRRGCRPACRSFASTVVAGWPARAALSIVTMRARAGVVAEAAGRPAGAGRWLAGPGAAARTASTPESVLAMAVRSGRVISTAGPEVLAASLSRPRQWRGFLALATLPVSRWTSASTRSPARPRAVTSLARRFSPSMDLTG